MNFYITEGWTVDILRVHCQRKKNARVLLVCSLKLCIERTRVCCLTIRMRRKYPKACFSFSHSSFGCFSLCLTSYTILNFTFSTHSIFSGRRFIFHRGSDFLYADCISDDDFRLYIIDIQKNNKYTYISTANASNCKWHLKIIGWTQRTQTINMAMQ